MACLQIRFKIRSVFVLLSILYLRTHAAISGPAAERRQLLCGKTLWTPSCREVCITGFLDERCNFTPTNFATTIGVTDGAIKPLSWPVDTKSSSNVTINSVEFFPIYTKETTNCKPILFLFYNEQNQVTGAGADRILIMPGLEPFQCYTIPNSTKFSGVIDLEHDTVLLGSPVTLPSRTSSLLPVNSASASILARSSSALSL
jgi:hypothetical protein